ncbi:hypothetical protein ACR3LQ_14820 [Kosakonia cowanii]|jgi:hypothetical protein|uniref:hypothetical protein n=1 Tax=Kosakonia cowanii TaxID=208223 RepID=UPI003EE614BF
MFILAPCSFFHSPQLSRSRLQAAASHLLSVGRAAKSASNGAGTDADSLKISVEIKNEASGNQSFDSHITGE